MVYHIPCFSYESTNFWLSIAILFISLISVHSYLPFWHDIHIYPIRNEIFLFKFSFSKIYDHPIFVCHIPFSHASQYHILKQRLWLSSLPSSRWYPIKIVFCLKLYPLFSVYSQTISVEFLNFLNYVYCFIYLLSVLSWYTYRKRERERERERERLHAAFSHAV